MNDKVFKITWEAADGYVGGSRPHTTKLKLEDFGEDMTLEEIREQIFDEIQADFEQKVTPDYSTADVDAIAAQIHEALEVRR